MDTFQRILVGVDLAVGDRYVGHSLEPPAREAVRMAVALAKANAAELTFCYVLDDSTMQLSARHEILEENERGEPTILGEADAELAELATEVREQSLKASTRVLIGRSWKELIREVLEHAYDMLIVGSRPHSGVRNALLGSTAIKLLRKCPCPVWIAKPLTKERIGSILVATDLSPVGDDLLRVGASLAQLHGSVLHVLYAYEYPTEKSLLPPALANAETSEQRSTAAHLLREKLAALQLPLEPRLHLPQGAPCPVILDCIEREQIELLVVGTLSRAGVVGMITGSNAERLLPSVPCSVLGLKPAGFRSPLATAE